MNRGMFVHKIIILVTLASYSQCRVNSPSEISAPDQELTQQDCKLSMEFQKKMYSYIKNARAFKNMSLTETAAFMQELCEFEAPLDIQKNYGYSLLGYDFERRPVWYYDVGRQDYRRIVENGTYPILERFFLQFLIPLVQSIQASDTPDEEIRHGVYVWNLEGFSMKQLGHIPTATAIIKMTRKYNDIPSGFVGKAFLININYVTKLAIDIARPLLGNLLDRVEAYGGNRNIWLPRLLKTIPIDIVPSWLGGKNGTNPLAVYG